MVAGLDMQVLLGLLAVAYMAVRSYRRASLTPGGCIAATLVGTIHALHPHRPLLLLLVFFLTGTKLTSWGHELKQELLADADRAVLKEGTTKKRGRTAMQVFCNSGPATLLLLMHSLYLSHYAITPRAIALSSSLPDLLTVGVIAQYAAAAGDTYASEIGVLNDDWPLLITNLKKVPPGTNGGVSLLGMLASLMGGGVMGATAMLLPAHSLLTRAGLFCIAVCAGLYGSLIDSVLGATLQRTVYDQEMKKVLEAHGGTSVKVQANTDKFIVIGSDVLDNNQVNLVSALVTMTTAMISLGILSIIYEQVSARA